MKYVLTVPEFAQRLGISTNTAYRMLAEGLGPRIIRTRVHGGAIRIPVVAFEEWLARGSEDATSSAAAKAGPNTSR